MNVDSYQTSNLILGIIFILLIVALVIVIFKIFGVNKVKKWLLWAVTLAESKYGSGTGKLKLAYVYDLFTSKFKILQAIIPYELFSKLVDEALILMREALENERISDYVKTEML